MTHPSQSAALLVLLLTLGLAACGIVGLGMTAACAHAVLTVSDPPDGISLASTPAAVRLTFSEPVSPALMRLLQPDGSILRLADVTVAGTVVVVALPQGSGPGTRIVNWRVVSADSHPVGGSITFSVGGGGAVREIGTLQAPAARVAIWATGLVLWLCLVMSVGAALFGAWVFRGIAGRLAIPVRCAAGLGLLDLGLVAVLQAADVAGMAPWDLHAADVRTFGLGNGQGFFLALLASAFLAAMATTGRRSSRLPQVFSLLAAVALATGFAFNGHAATAPPAALMRPAIVLHVLGVLVWLGSLPSLLLVLSARGPGGPDGARAFAAVSRPLFAASVVLLATGSAMAVVQVVRVAELWGSGYGVVLGAKLAAVLPMFGLGAINRYRLVPRFLAGEKPRPLRLTIATEIVLGVVALGIVGLWRFTPPPRAMAGTSVTVNGLQFHAHGIAAMANLVLSPARVGRTRLSIAVMNIDATPLEAKDVAVAMFEPSGRLDPLRFKAQRQTGTTWVADGLDLPVPGRWTVRIDIFLTDFDKASIKAPVDIARQ